jgi:hypothetical protein
LPVFAPVIACFKRILPTKSSENGFLYTFIHCSLK